MKIFLVIGACVALSGCAGLQSGLDVAAAILGPTPEQTCHQGGGDWVTVTTYDPQGNPTYHHECIQHDPAHRRL